MTAPDLLDTCKRRKSLCLALASALLAAQALLPGQVLAATWEWKWTPVEGETAPRVEVCPLKYGKSWAYSFEQDDGGVGALTVSQPLFARYRWNDAPPGLPGGQNKPFVGTAALILGSLGGNYTALSIEQVAQLQNLGWGIVNHSFWHSGIHWDPKLRNTPEQNRRELFWSQTFYAEFVGHGRAATHFVYPNGDYNYGPFLNEYGLLAGTRTSGWSPHNLASPKLNLLNYPRTYLDENNWAKSDNPMQDFPDKPETSDFLIDFTHGIDGNAESANAKRWVARLDHIARTWGPEGDNTMWVAPSDEVIAYHLASRDAQARAVAGKVTIELPDTAPGSALTLKISGLNANANLQVPQGGTLYRQGETAWLTTPLLGTKGSAPPQPRVKLIYRGEVKSLTFEQPVAIAGIRINRSGKLPDDFVLKADAISPNGTATNIASVDKAGLDKKWGNLLYPVYPDHPNIVTKELQVTTDKGLSQMEVWGVAP